MSYVVRLALRTFVAAVCFWFAIRVAVEGSEILARALKLPADEVLPAVVLGAALPVVMAWEPKRSSRSVRRPRRYYR